MARIGITYVDVAKAATQLQHENKNPTVDGVRAILGTGSKSTIAPLLKDWKVKHEGLTTDINAGLPVEILTVVKELYQRMQNEVLVQANEQKLQFDKEIESIRSELNQENQTVIELQEKLTETTQKNEKLEGEI